ncbi:MAG: STAS-like domain-containing protein [Armatimonadetes bacterium]|nr:STAS-like domain-containing protein [Armatimonadota bacterium]
MKSTVVVAQLARTPYCVAAEDGDKVHEAVAAAIRAGVQVEFSFEGVEDLTSVFLNAAVGRLWGEYDDSFLRTQLLPPVAATPRQLALLKRIVERAKRYFADRATYEAAERGLFEDADA